MFARITEAVTQRCSVKKASLEILQNSQENTCVRVSFLIKLQASVCNFIKKETLAQVFFCEFCEISKNTFFHGTPLVNTSGIMARKDLFMLHYIKKNPHKSRNRMKLPIKLLGLLLNPLPMATLLHRKRSNPSKFIMLFKKALLKDAVKVYFRYRETFF